MLEAVWLIPALPAIGFVLLVVFGRQLGEPWAGWLATALTFGSFGVALLVFAGLLDEPEHERQFVQTLFEWVPAGSFTVDVGFLVDPLSMTMVLFITGVGALIHLYSIGYMHGDDRFPTFFVYLNLFVFSMLLLVLGDNLLLTFLGWEGVGACSYFLISFWFTRETAAVAGKKAFITNRIGDWGFMTATFLTFTTFGTITYVGENGFLERAGGLTQTTATAIALLLFVGAVGKSAQLPLYVWLPDAMEGPTPVSALIHAATMVTSGVYLMARINPILALSEDALTLIAVVGALTALFAATVAMAQDDIKKVLAYSTVSQLGYMFLAIGSGAYVAAIFHMVTHAFFKALLFLGAGSVIHGLHDEQDMKRMGALRKLMPITAVTFIIGWLAIAGVPPFAGFWSKDDILLNAWDKSPFLWFIGLVTAGLTAYYMTRQVILVFYGEARWAEHGAGHGPEEAEALPEHEPSAVEPAGDAVGDHAEGEHARPHESPWLMWVPLAVLAALSVVGGGLNLPFAHTHHLETFLEPVFEGGHLRHIDMAGAGKVGLAAAATLFALLGIFVAVQVYVRKAVPEGRFEPEALRRAWGVNDAYAAFFAGPGRRIADACMWIDVHIVDGAVNGIATLARGGGSRLRVVQTGYVRTYALGMAGGAVLLLGFFLLRAG